MSGRRIFRTRTSTGLTSRTGPTSRTGLTGLALAALLTAAAGCGSPDPVEQPQPKEPVGPPANTSAYWVDPDSSAARQVKEWTAQGRTDDATEIKKIADRPVANWPAGDNPAPDVRRATAGAAEEGRTAVLVAYNIPHRDCGQHSAGGAPDADAYRRWLDSFAQAIGNASATVVLEPDAVPHIVDGCTPAEAHGERNALLTQAIERLKRQPRTKVYLDAGNPAWIDDPGKLVDPLRRAGIERADGFSLNVSNFQRDDTVRAYGAKLAGLLGGGAHFVVDSSRNGAGPLPGSRADAWCNPSGRALGTPPTDRTGDPLLDAYLWIKRPGDSDGKCRGGPSAGTWWPDYALGLARKSR